MSKCFLNIIILIFFGLNSFSQVEIDSASSKFILTGKVIDNVTKEPIEGVRITIYIDSLERVLNGETDSLGNYSIAINPNPYNIALEVTFFGIMCESKNSTSRYFEKIKYISTDLINILNVNINPIYEISCFAGPDIDYFLYDSRGLLPNEEGMVEVEKLITYMKENPELIVEIGTHTDCNGSEKRNMKSSNKRAKALINYIVSQGISEDRIFGKGYGETRLLNKCDC